VYTLSTRFETLFGIGRARGSSSSRSSIDSPYSFYSSSSSSSFSLLLFILLLLLVHSTSLTIIIRALNVLSCRARALMSSLLALL
jgi:hypothetical protein